MPAGPNFCAATQPESSNPASFQPLSAFCAAFQSEPVRTISGSPCSNSTRSRAMNPAGFGSVPSFFTAAASTLAPGRNCFVTSCSVAEWKFEALATLPPLT